MMTRSILYAAAAAFFVSTNLLVCIKTQELDVTSISTPSPDISATPTIAAGIETLPTLNIRSAVAVFFPPDIFSHPDPLAFFLDKLTRKAYNSGREVLAFTGHKWRSILHSLDYYLEKQKFPRPYVLYARLLSVLLTCLDKLHRVSKQIFEMQQKHFALFDYPPRPTGISTPELRDLLSTDVFSDSEIPSVLVKKILKIPDDRMPDATADLVKLLREHNYVEQPYFEYMHNLRIFFQSRDDIYRLRIEDANIRRRFQKNQNKPSKASS